MSDRLALYGISTLVLVGCFALIWASRGQEEQVWLAVGLILGNLFRSEAGNSAASNVERIAAAQPTVTTSGNPPRTTVTPPDVPA